MVRGAIRPGHTFRPHLIAKRPLFHPVPTSGVGVVIGVGWGLCRVGYRGIVRSGNGWVAGDWG